MALLRKLIQKIKNRLFPIRKYILDQHFRLNYDHQDRFFLVIDLLDGPFKNTTYAYTDIKIQDTGKVTSSIRVLESTFPPDFDFTSDEKFGRIVEDIFITTFEMAQKNYQDVRSEILKNEDDRTEYLSYRDDEEDKHYRRVKTIQRNN